MSSVAPTSGQIAAPGPSAPESEIVPSARFTPEIEIVPGGRFCMSWERADEVAAAARAFLL